MLSLLETQTPSNISPTFHYSKIIGQQDPTDRLIHILINYHNDNNISYISPSHSSAVDNSLTHLDMPQRTPARTSPFHQHHQQFSFEQSNNNAAQLVGSSTTNSSTHTSNTTNTSNNNNVGRGAFNSSSSNISMNNIHQSNNMLDSMNHGNNMYLFQANSSENNSTCNNSITPTTNTSSLHFHNMNNNQIGVYSTSSNKKRKQESSSSANITTNSENAIFYHMETDFKRKHTDKKRLVWTNDLHELFVKAVDQLGLQEARPKEILELMNLPDLTTTHIKSHLQKYRQQVKKGIIPTGGSGSLSSELGATDSENSDSGQNEDVKQEMITTSAPTTTTSATSLMNNSHAISGNQNNPMYNATHSNPSSSTAQTSTQNFSSLINDNNSDQVNYIKNILLHFNQIGNSDTNLNSNNDENHSSYLSSSSYQRPLQQHVTFANSITNNNITTVNQPLFRLGDGRNILQNCHLLTSANSLSEFLVLLQEICQTESDMATIFNSLPVRSTNDLNLIVEGFRIGFICGMKFKP